GLRDICATFIGLDRASTRRADIVVDVCALHVRHRGGWRDAISSKRIDLAANHYYGVIGRNEDRIPVDEDEVVNVAPVLKYLRQIDTYSPCRVPLPNEDDGRRVGFRGKPARSRDYIR